MLVRVTVSGSGASARASTVRTPWRLLSKCRRHFSNFKCWELVARRWRQLQLEAARAQTAERERSALTQTLGAMRTDRGGAMVDTKGIRQPFMLKGTADQDFGEWTHRVRTFMLGRFGEQILGAVIWHHVNGKSLSKVADLRRETASYTGLEKVEKVPMRRTRSTRSMISLESSTHTLSLSQPTQPTRRRQRLGSLETTAQRARPHVVHETSGDSSAGSEPTALSAS